MNKLTDIPKSEVPSVVKEALRASASKVEVTKQVNGKYSVTCWK
ncbi:hypothetical protein [Vibrio sp. Of7-15]|nr:hypothetical protein [Vibrio sp. Of7-15]